VTSAWTIWSAWRWRRSERSCRRRRSRNRKGYARWRLTSPTATSSPFIR